MLSFAKMKPVELSFALGFLKDTGTETRKSLGHIHVLSAGVVGGG